MTKQTALKHIAKYEAAYKENIAKAQAGEAQVELLVNMGGVNAELVLNYKQMFVVTYREAAQVAKDTANNYRKVYGV